MFFLVKLLSNDSGDSQDGYNRFQLHAAFFACIMGMCEIAASSLLWTMEENLYRIINENSIHLQVEMKDFDPVHTFLCGQFFRWNQEGNGVWAGIALGRYLKIS